MFEAMITVVQSKQASVYSSKKQYSPLPRSLVDEDGFLQKANKSHWTDKLQQQHQLIEPRVFINQPQWVPQAVIIDAMFVINTKPLRRTITICPISMQYRTARLEQLK